MKKQTTFAMAAVLAMSVAGTALAAPGNPFSDVPAKHWAYNSISKLSQAGLISGYDDGSFKGDKTLTRYEVAVIVAKAMNNTDKMDAESKKALEALQVEFSSELNSLGVRMNNVEKKLDNVKFSGEFRERLEYAKGHDNALKSRLRLTASAAVDNNWTFKGRFASEGITTSESGKATTSATSVDQAYLRGNVGKVELNIGRQPLFLGQGLLADKTDNWDGVKVVTGSNLKFSAGVLQRQSGTAYDTSFYFGNISAKVANGVVLNATHFEDKDAKYYKTTAIGVQYNGLKNFTLGSEFGKNESGLGDAKASYTTVKYLKANPKVVGSLGTWVGYRKAESNFDSLGFAGDSTDIASFAGKNMNDIKGFEYAVEYTMFKNGILTIQYNDFKNYNETTDKKNVITRINYTF